MIGQINDELLQSLYFPHSSSKVLVALAFIILISVGLTAAILIRKQKLNNKSKVILLSISFVFGGIILGGAPNVVLVIQNIKNIMDRRKKCYKLLVRNYSVI